MIKLSNITKFFEDKSGINHVLRSIDMDVAEGEFVSIMGPSGRNRSHRDVYGLVSKIQKAAVSIPANIAEGHGREHLGDYHPVGGFSRRLPAAHAAGQPR